MPVSSAAHLALQPILRLLLTRTTPRILTTPLAHTMLLHLLTRITHLHHTIATLKSDLISIQIALVTFHSVLDALTTDY